MSGLFDDAHFDGGTYEPDKDRSRLTTQLQRVFNVMSDGRWRTPDSLVSATGNNWASISARLRDLRKDRFGGWRVERRRKGGGLFEYRLVTCPDQETSHAE